MSYSGNYESYYGRVIQFDLGNINPLNFKKIRIIYKNIDNIFIKASLGEYHNYANNINYGKTINDFFKENNIKDIIKNESVISKERVEDVGYSVIDRFSIIDQKTPYFLLDWKINSLVSKKKIGLNFYWKENHYYLQILLYQYAYSDKFLGDGGILRMGIGKGIELYNY